MTTSEPIKRKELASSVSPEANRSKKHEGGDVCVICSGPATDTDVLECVWCEGLQHRSCTEISVEKYAALSNLPSNIVFFCTHCAYKLPSALMAYDKTKEACSVVEDTITSKLKSLEITLTNKFSTLTDQINGLSTKMNHESNIEMMTDAHPQTQAQAPSNLNNLSAESIATMTASLMSEEKEKEKRKLNVIIHNFPESTLEDAQARKQDDIKNINSLLAKYVGVSASISNAVRLGKKLESPRLLKIAVSSKEEKTLILRNRLKLRNKENPPNILKVFITSDLTPLEQQKQKQLRSQLSEMNKSGNKYYIKNGRITLRQQSSPPNE